MGSCMCLYNKDPRPGKRITSHNYTEHRGDWTQIIIPAPTNDLLFDATAQLREDITGILYICCLKGEPRNIGLPHVLSLIK